jgi:hypothetical protein
MSSPFLTMLGVGSFVLVTGAATLAIVVLVMRGLVLQSRQRGQAKRLAAAEGWTYAGHDQFTCPMGEREWRGGPHEDDDDGRRWTDFLGGVPGVAPGGYEVLLRSAPASADRASWRALDVGSPAFRQRWVLRASTPSWAAVWTPAVDMLWLQAHAVHPGEIGLLAEQHFLMLQRDDGKTEPTLDQVAAFLRVGHALMKSTLAVARAPA